MIRAFLPPDAPLLRKVSAQVDKFSNDELRTLVDDMFETMRDGNGVGLAAPQIGVDARIIVIEFSGNEERAPGESPVPPTVLINPVITSGVGRTEGREGCFSVPGKIGIVPRYATIEYTAQDMDGLNVRGKAEGFHARIIQHEVDHLNGILYIDIASEVSLYQREPVASK
ncbi:peptide deformylase [Pseudomonas amygdali pv. morsprunorum]|uniref:Peptide deformylase n=3 Tax=Pseudomonas syringae group TaxID=136849 RepID=D3GAN0_PSESX|nr:MULTISPECIES: peptide deformylase [Pseudomonas syringae group]PPS23873.1 peptide deformylase [Pseudomonas amygdali pv. morsprunorum]ACV72595.1 peptide deformylase [Pseudomonas syringae pv. cerasicola]KWS94196.1 peptide deformylase [Pseudomonas syringae pv. cerasicola]PHN75388.1 peptide deformylase [Pseudomonas syringae pv. cerasicola]PPS33656.1 peptide deformylase [Pseudomonas amygdali pv. morsprunorum]